MITAEAAREQSKTNRDNHRSKAEERELLWIFDDIQRAIQSGALGFEFRKRLYEKTTKTLLDLGYNVRYDPVTCVTKITWDQ